MHDAVAAASNRNMPVVVAARTNIPALAEVSWVIASALLLILSFPNFELWPLAWIGVAPFLLIVARPLKLGRALVLGWLWGAVFFYGTCWWLAYPMIHYAHIPPRLAYPLLLLPIALVALFPALFSVLLCRLVAQLGSGALLTAPLLWVTCEWARYEVTGQLWNALGYSQAFHPVLIQSARWGGVYAVGFLIVTANAAMAFALLNRRAKGLSLSLVVLLSIMLVIGIARVGGTRNRQVHARASDNGDVCIK